MLEGESIVYFGPEPWEGLWRNRHQLMSIFARRNKVLYIEPRRSLRRLGKDKRAAPETKRTRLRNIQDDLFVLRAPAFMAVSGKRLVEATTSRLFRASVRRHLARLGMAHPITWVSRPRMAAALDVTPSKLSIYHVVDEYAAYGRPTAERKRRLHELERELLQRVDMAIVVSKRLLETKKPYNPDTFLVPNAVDYAVFEEALNGSPQDPHDVAPLPGPRLGYSGLVGGRLDLKLLLETAERFPQASLVFVGSVKHDGCESEIAALKARGNVHFLGRKPVADVPRYVRAFDVCLIPYRTGEEADNIDPLKLYDYLACGKPVVSVDIPAVRPFAEVATVAGDSEAFLQGVAAALEDDGSLRERRRSVAKENTWEARVETLSEHMRAVLEKKAAAEKRNKTK